MPVSTAAGRCYRAVDAMWYIAGPDLPHRVMVRIRYGTSRVTAVSAIMSVIRGVRTFTIASRNPHEERNTTRTRGGIRTFPWRGEESHFSESTALSCGRRCGSQGIVSCRVSRPIRRGATRLTVGARGCYMSVLTKRITADTLTDAAVTDRQSTRTRHAGAGSVGPARQCTASRPQRDSPVEPQPGRSVPVKRCQSSAASLGTDHS
jgi:hypothetical protein